MDTETVWLTESGETTGVFRSSAVTVIDTKAPSVGDGRVSWGMGDTVAVVYGDVNSADTTVDTALALEIGTTGVVTIYEDVNYTDDVDTLLTKDMFLVQVQDTDENRNPQVKDTVLVKVYVGNGTSE